uniref:Uncharacterized protein n=1 Tax=Culex tarsalis TaxID=7177 RepID=A0A1Q3G309_CULTA
MHRRRRSSDDVTSRNTYHEIENDDDDEDAHDDHGARDQNFPEPEPGSSHNHNHNDHDQYRQLQHQHQLQRPEQSRQQQQNTRAFVHSEAHPEPAAEESLLRHRQQQWQQSGRRPGERESSDVAGRNAAQSGRAVKRVIDDGQVMLDDKSVADVSE